MKRYGVTIVLCVLGILTGIWIGKSKFGNQGAVLRQTTDVSNENRICWEWKEQKPVKSKLKDTSRCWLCGEDNRSLMGYFRKFNDVGIICVNNWYVLDFKVRNHDEEGNLTGTDGGSRSGFVGTGEGGCMFQTSQNSDRGISSVKVTYGEDSIFDASKVQKHLCQTCLDKLIEVMETYGEESEPARPRDLCMVDFQTLELYPLQEHNISYFIRDYYIQVDSRDDELEVEAIYTPMLENGVKPGE